MLVTILISKSSESDNSDQRHYEAMRSQGMRDFAGIFWLCWHELHHHHTSSQIYLKSPLTNTETLDILSAAWGLCGHEAPAGLSDSSTACPGIDSDHFKSETSNPTENLRVTQEQKPFACRDSAVPAKTGKRSKRQREATARKRAEKLRELQMAVSNERAEDDLSRHGKWVAEQTTAPESFGEIAHRRTEIANPCGKSSCNMASDTSNIAGSCQLGNNSIVQGTGISNVPSDETIDPVNYKQDNMSVLQVGATSAQALHPVQQDFHGLDERLALPTNEATNTSFWFPGADLTQVQRIHFGQMCKKLVDHGRLQWLKGMSWQVRLECLDFLAPNRKPGTVGL